MSLLGLPRLTFVQTLDLLGLGCEAKRCPMCVPGRDCPAGVISTQKEDQSHTYFVMWPLHPAFLSAEGMLLFLNNFGGRNQISLIYMDTHEYIYIYTLSGVYLCSYYVGIHSSGSDLLFVYLVQFLTCFVSYCNGAFPGMD